MKEDSPVKKEVSNALYHVGERVTINSKIWLAAQRLDEYGSVIHSDSATTCRFTSTMTKYCGRTVTIDRVKVNVFGKHLYTFKEIPYMWHSYMFVPAIEEDSIEVEEHVDKKSELTEYQIGDTVKTPMGNEAIIISNSLSGYYDIVYTSSYGAGYLDKTDSETTLLEAGKYKSLINTELSPDIIARSLRNFSIIDKSDAHNIEVGDEVTCVEDFGKAIVIFSGIVCQVYTIDTKEVINVRKDLLKVVNKGPYVAYIDVSKTTTEKIATLHELLDKKSNSSAYNSSEFDLTKVIYKSKRIY